jgi:hypothetical protein
LLDGAKTVCHGDSLREDELTWGWVAVDVAEAAKDGQMLEVGHRWRGWCGGRRRPWIRMWGAVEQPKMGTMDK